MKSSARSTLVRCAAPRSTTSSLSAIAACSSSACGNGVYLSSSPATINDRARMFDTWVPQIGIAKRRARGDVAGRWRGLDHVGDATRHVGMCHAERGAEESRDDALADRRHATCAHCADSFVPRLRRADPRRRIGEHGATDPLLVMHGNPERRDASEREAAEVRPLDLQMVEQRDHIGAEPVDGCRTGRHIRSTMTAAVEADHAKVLRQRFHLRLGHAQVGAE